MLCDQIKMSPRKKFFSVFYKFIFYFVIPGGLLPLTSRYWKLDLFLTNSLGKVDDDDVPN